MNSCLIELLKQSRKYSRGAEANKTGCANRNVVGIICSPGWKLICQKVVCSYVQLHTLHTHIHHPLFTAFYFKHNYGIKNRASPYLLFQKSASEFTEDKTHTRFELHEIGRNVRSPLVVFLKICSIKD